MNSTLTFMLFLGTESLIPFYWKKNINERQAQFQVIIFLSLILKLQKKSN